MNTALQRKQYASIIRSRGHAYLYAGVTYYGVERDEEPGLGEFPEAPNNQEWVVLHVAIEAGKTPLQNNRVLTDDQGDRLKIISVRNKPREGYQILTCEAAR